MPDLPTRRMPPGLTPPTEEYPPASAVWAQFRKADESVDDRRDEPYVFNEESDHWSKQPKTMEMLLHELGIMPPVTPLARDAGILDIPLDPQKDQIKEFLEKPLPTPNEIPLQRKLPTK